ncbi:MAG: hypothetical protein KAS32_18905, partial [Candidatus Peribacteraceae bacterium]|nr:hypothetical protein [Candidatus Peribacteraceae bacterium]
MSRKNVENRFNSGVIADVSEDMIAPDALKGAHNIAITSNDDKQFILQKTVGISEIPKGFPDDIEP